MTKMAAIPIYDKKSLNMFSSSTRSLMIFKFGMEHQRLKIYKVCIKDDPWLTLTDHALVAFLYQVSVCRTISPLVVKKVWGKKFED